MYLEPSADECICSECGARMEKIGIEFVRRELEIIPARARVVEYYSVNYGCKNCRRNAALPNIVKGKYGRYYAGIDQPNKYLKLRFSEFLTN